MHSSLPPVETQSPPAPLRFELAVRGYDRRQVDAYVAQLSSELTLREHHQTKAGQKIQELLTKVGRLEQELEHQRRMIPGDNPSFSHLGARAEHILRLAEEEAEEISRLATAEAEKRLKSAEKKEVERREALDAEITEATRIAQEEASRAKEEAAELTRQTEELKEKYRHEREAAERRARDDAERYSRNLRSEAEADAQRILTTARHDAQALVANAQHDAERLRNDAQHARDAVYAEIEKETQTLAEQRDRLRGEITQLQETLRRIAGTSTDLLRDNFPQFP